MSGCCGQGCSLDGLRERQRGTLCAVLGINALMFFVIAATTARHCMPCFIPPCIAWQAIVTARSNWRRGRRVIMTARLGRTPDPQPALGGGA